MRSVFTLIISVLLPLAVLAAPRETTTVLAPGGPRSPDDIHLVPDSGSLLHVGDAVHILDDNGNTIKHITLEAPSPLLESRALKTGWITYASWFNQNASPIKNYTASWTVPPVPKTEHGQTVFLFTAIEPGAGGWILQPVLQYGPSSAGGGPYWSVSSWYLAGKSVFHTAPVRVSAGKSLTGAMTLTGVSGAKYSYKSRFTNVDGTTLTVNNATQLVLKEEGENQ
ncbi:hypothetical protein MIND_00180700 [Mycena indigotica]|uniref:Uncharacterized protein n=1 Tax=Mycena indigotica TaxID=2126181 RepID=A0A8H6T616_9AGAR|nr:uncharacterized protein MIND_00180700 [Mycena indigotica]KAF7311708.1 hypothetical protein MIND_00180700 [Mycena indigotica]